MSNYALHRFLLMTLDPVHVGTGGYRLGRVDLSVVREPGTRLPKIPGTSFSGAVRQYAAYRYGKRRCAGQGDHCGEPTCPICYTFGIATGDSGGYSGVINLFDAHILLFPVHSMAGPVWVTSPDRLRLAGLQSEPADPGHEQIAIGPEIDAPQGQLNLGWLLLESNGQRLTLENAPEEWQADEWNVVQDRIVLVSDKLFGHIVNANLEVRTSVSISPETGAAEEGALFTYEAIPRSAFLVSDAVQDDFRQDKFPRTDKTVQGNDLESGPWERPFDVVRAGFEMIEWLGVGGMGTRGFGRMRTVGEPKEEVR